MVFSLFLEYNKIIEKERKKQMKVIGAVFKLSEILELPPSIVFEAAREVKTIEKDMQQEINPIQLSKILNVICYWYTL